MILSKAIKVIFSAIFHQMVVYKGQLKNMCTMLPGLALHLQHAPDGIRAIVCNFTGVK